MDTGLFSSKSFLGLLCEVPQIVNLEFGVTQNLIDQESGCVTRFKNIKLHVSELFS